jgi:subtilisin family serine protease
MLLTVWLALADDQFFPGEGPELLSFNELLASKKVLGVSGVLLVEAEDGTVFAEFPEIVSVKPHPGGLLELSLEEGADLFALSRALHEKPGVRWAHPDLVLPVSPRFIPDDPLYSEEWHLDNTGQGGRLEGVDINAPLAWDYATGAGILIAVLDSGVQLDHPDLQVVAGYDYIDKDSDPTPVDNPHGTCVSGVAGAAGNNGYGMAGVAFESTIYGIRLIGGQTTTLDIYDAFIEAVDAGAGVINNSWGFGDCEEVSNYRVFTTMLDYAESMGRGGLGTVAVISAGNGGCDIGQNHFLENETFVVVAAVEPDDIRASYSSFGESVDIAAPTSIFATDVTGGGYGDYEGDDAFINWFSGTSAAAPVVSGVVALMLEANSRLTAAQVREILCQTAVRNDAANAGYNAAGWSPYYGCGRVDAAAAVAAVANAEPLAPVPNDIEEVLVEQAFLSWEPAEDADGDVVGYELLWWVEGQDEATAASLSTVETMVDLSQSVQEGWKVLWKVRAKDPWGAGPWSEMLQFKVVKARSQSNPPSSCQTAAGPFYLLLAALFLRRNR